MWFYMICHVDLSLLDVFCRTDHAFKPKDMKLNKKVSSANSGSKLTESEIKKKISRLTQLLANKVFIF